MCRHLIGVAEIDDPEHVRVLTGRGIEFDLCCPACDAARAAGRPPGLVQACEGCVARVAELGWSDMLGWRGEPGIAERPEPLDPAVTVTPLPDELSGAADLAAVPGASTPEWAVLTAAGRIGIFDAGTGRFRAARRCVAPAEVTVRKPYRGRGIRPRLLVSARGEFAAVVNDYGTLGAVVDLATMRTTLALDGGDYHPETVPLSAAFLEHGGRAVIVHRTAWNRLDASDAATGELLTSRTQASGGPSQRPEHYLDYFHGAVHPSPDGRWLADDGWAWHPAGAPVVWDARRWLDGGAWESEDGPSRRVLCLRSDWDVPMCWLTGDLLAVSGIGSMEVLLAGVRVFSVSAGKEVRAFAGPAGRLFSDAGRLYAAGRDGLVAWDPRTGERTWKLPGFTPRWHHPGAGELVELRDGALHRWRSRQ
jgi:hypothetical protein